MTKPTLVEFGLSDSEYLTFKSYPKLVEKRFIWAGAILGSAVWIILSHKNLIDTLYYLIAGWILGSIIFLAFYGFFGHFFIERHKLYPKASKYETALLAYQRRQEQYWKSLKGPKFEKELRKLFSSHGYSAKLTPSTGDRGIDIILMKGDITTIVQCKGYSKPVGPAIARELYGTLIDSGYSSAILASTSGFTKGAYDFVKGKKIKLLSLNDIIRMVEEIQNQNSL